MSELKEFRCKCGQLLMRVKHVPGTHVESKCRRCKNIAKLKLAPPVQKALTPPPDCAMGGA